MQQSRCDRPDVDAIILGAVSYDGLTPTVQEIGHQKPIIAAVNDIDDRGIRAKASVPWREMGRAAGEVIARLHPKGSSPVRVAWIPGPKGAGWVDFVDRGFREALADSAAVIVTERFGDTGLEPQVLLVEDVIDTSEDIDYLVGSGPMAEAAVSILRARKLSDRIGVVSTYMSHAVYRGIKRDKIVAAPTDFAVMQGRLAVEMAVRALEGSLTVVHAGPRIVTVTPDTIDQIGPDGSLAPANFSARFTAGPEQAPSSSD